MKLGPPRMSTKTGAWNSGGAIRARSSGGPIASRKSLRRRKCCGLRRQPDGAEVKKRSPEDWLIVAAPVVFVVLWSSGFIGTKTGVLHAEPMTFLSLRMGILV